MGLQHAHEGGRKRVTRGRIGRGALAVALIAGAMALGSAPALGDSFRVRASGSDGDYSWSPSSRTITKGDKIVWTNSTDSRHTVTSYSGRWSKNTEIQIGEKTRKRFRKAGTYKFRCTVRGHSSISNGRCVGMCGTIKVTR